MSLTTWKKEFYPIRVGEEEYRLHMNTRVRTERDREAAAIAHSLHKWRGLTPENLAKHEVTIRDASVYDSYGDSLDVNDRTCSLCYEFFRSTVGRNCGSCPIRNSTDRCSSAPSAPYGIFRKYGVSAPMIKCLEDALAKAEAEYHQPPEATTP